VAKRYKDKPRYKAINGYEKEFKKQFSSVLSLALKDVEKKMYQMIK
jgi:hypothetical protein